MSSEGSVMEPTKPSDIFLISEELVLFVVYRGEIGEINLITEKTTDPTETLHELSCDALDTVEEPMIYKIHLLLENGW